MDYTDGLSQVQGILLSQETDSAKHLLAFGLRSLREAAFLKTMQDPVMTMLSIGTEKLLKVSLGLLDVADGKPWPSKSHMKDVFGHDLLRMEGLLHEGLRSNVTRATHRPVVEAELDAIELDIVLPPLLNALDRYGQSGRFYYLDALAESRQMRESPADLWTVMEQAALAKNPELRAVYDRYLQDLSLASEFNRLSNGTAAESLEDLWRGVAVAGQHGVLGERGKAWGADLLQIGRQVAGD